MRKKYKLYMEQKPIFLTISKCIDLTKEGLWLKCTLKVYHFLICCPVDSRINFLKLENVKTKFHIPGVVAKLLLLLYTSDLSSFK